jgi:hypothetical protein
MQFPYRSSATASRPPLGEVFGDMRIPGLVLPLGMPDPRDVANAIIGTSAPGSDPRVPEPWSQRLVPGRGGLAADTFQSQVALRPETQGALFESRLVIDESDRHGRAALGSEFYTVPVIAIQRQGRRLSRRGHYRPVPSTRDDGYCLLDVTRDLRSVFHHSHPFQVNLTALEVVSSSVALPSVNTIIESGLGVMTLGGDLHWRGPLPDIVIVLEENFGSVWHAVGWAYVNDDDHLLAACDSELPHVRVGAKDARGSGKYAPRTGAIVRSALTRAKNMDPALSDPVEAAIEVLKTAKFTGRIDVRGATGLDEQVVLAWNARQGKELPKYRPMSVTQAMQVSGFEATLSSKVRMGDPHFSPLGKGVGSWSFDIGTLPEPEAFSSAGADFDMVGSYALARALSLPARMVYVVSSWDVPSFAVNRGVHWAAAPPLKLATPCVVVFLDSTEQQYALWSGPIHQAKVREPAAKITVLMVQLMQQTGTGHIKDLAFHCPKEDPKMMYAMSGQYAWQGRGEVGRSLACLDSSVHQVCRIGVYRCDSGEASVRSRPSHGEPTLMVDDAKLWPEDIKTALLRHWATLSGSQIAPQPLFIKGGPQDQDIEPDAPGPAGRHSEKHPSLPLPPPVTEADARRLTLDVPTPDSWEDLDMSTAASEVASEVSDRMHSAELAMFEVLIDQRISRLEGILRKCVGKAKGCTCHACLRVSARGAGSPDGLADAFSTAKETGALGKGVRSVLPPGAGRVAQGPPPQGGWSNDRAGAPRSDSGCSGPAGWARPPPCPCPPGGGGVGPPPPPPPPGPPWGGNKTARPRRPRRYAPIVVGRAPRADWWWAGPGGIHKGQSAYEKAGDDPVGLPPLAAVMVQTLAEKSSDPKASQARYNIATNAFFSQNAEYKRSGLPMLTDDDRALMVANVSPFLDYCVAHKEYREHVHGPRYAQVLASLLTRAKLESKGFFARWFGKFVLWWRSIWHAMWGYKFNPFRRPPPPKPKGGVIALSRCPRRLLTNKLKQLPHFPSPIAAKAFLEECDETKVHLAVTKEPPDGAFSDCSEPPRPTFSVGPHLDIGAECLSGCACQAYFTMSERCTKGALSDATCDPSVATDVFSHALAEMTRAADEHEGDLANALEDAPTTLEEYGRQAKFARKYGLMSKENWVQPVLGPPVSTMLVKREKVYRDARGRLVIDASAKNSAQAMGPHQALMLALKATLVFLPAGDDRYVCTCGLNQAAIRDKFQVAADAGKHYCYLSDASALEATQCTLFQDEGDKILALAATFVERYHPDEDVKLQNSLALQQRSESRIHVMKFPDYAGGGARATELVANGYFITGSPWTTIGNTANIGAIVLKAAQEVLDAGHSPCQISVAGDDQISLFDTEEAAQLMMHKTDAIASSCALVFKSFLADTRTSPSTAVYNQKHVVNHEGTIWLFQNPARGLRNLGRVVQPNCADPRYLPGHAKAYLMSYCTEYAGVPLFHAYVTAGLAYYTGTRVHFDKDTAYWYGINMTGRPMTVAEASATARSHMPTCPRPTALGRRAYEQAFLISPARQEELEEALIRAWSAESWSMPDSMFQDVLGEDDCEEGQEGRWLGDRVDDPHIQARL